MKHSNATRTLLRAAVLAGMPVIPACQGASNGSAPPPASATAAVAAPESPPAGPPAPTAAPPAATANPGAGVPAASAGPGNAPDPSRELAAGTVNVAQMTAMTPGSKAKVRGLYLGWRGPCKGVPPTRSAWQLADADEKGAACLYVDGPVPPGLDQVGRGAPVWVRVDAQLITSGPSTFLTSQHAEKETP